MHISSVLYWYIVMYILLISIIIEYNGLKFYKRIGIAYSV